MTFITPTIPAVADPGPLVYAELETAMLGVGWTLEDTVVIGTRTHKVLKSAAAGNARGLDWWIDISYPTTGVATHLLMAPFEGYDAVTHLAVRGPVTAASATIETTYYSRYGTTGYALETNWANLGTYTALDALLTIASFGMWASVTRDRIIVMLSSEPTAVSYTGFFIPTAAHTAYAGAALFPLVMCRTANDTDRQADSTPASSEIQFTRVPKATSINWSNSALMGTSNHPMSGRVGAATANTVDGQFTVSPFTIAFNGLGFTNSYPGRTVMGQLDGVYCGYGDAAVTRGDTVTIGGIPYVTTTVSSTLITLFKAV